MYNVSQVIAPLIVFIFVLFSLYLCAGYEHLHKLLSPSAQPFLYCTVVLVCLAAFYLSSRLLAKKPRASAVRNTTTTGNWNVVRLLGRNIATPLYQLCANEDNRFYATLTL